MKKLYILMLISILSISATAQEKHRLVIEKNDNTTESIYFEALSRITFSNGNVVMEQQDGNIISNDMADITRIATYAGNTNISSVNDDKELIHYISSDEIAVNTHAGATIEIFSVSGSLILTTHQGADNGTISIASFPKGIYLLRSNGKTTKFLKR